MHAYVHMHSYTHIYIYIYIFMYVGSLGELVRLVRPPGTGKLVSISIAIRPCVARLSCAGAGKTCLINAGPVGGEKSSSPASVVEGFGTIVAAMHVGLDYIYQVYMDRARLLTFF